jgi:hypothetical protein
LIIKIKPHEINYYSSHFIFATASFAQSTISGKVVEKENLLQEQTSILMVLTMALLQTKRTIFVYNYCNRKPNWLLAFLFMKRVKQQSMLLILKQTIVLQEIVIHLMPLSFRQVPWKQVIKARVAS